MRPKLANLFFMSCGFILAVCASQTGAGISAVTPACASADDSRPADREAIRAHIEKIFKAYIDRDCAAIRATHARRTGLASPARHARFCAASMTT